MKFWKKKIGKFPIFWQHDFSKYHILRAHVPCLQEIRKSYLFPQKNFKRKSYFFVTNFHQILTFEEDFIQYLLTPFCFVSQISENFIFEIFHETLVKDWMTDENVLISDIRYGRSRERTLGEQTAKKTSVTGRGVYCKIIPRKKVIFGVGYFLWTYLVEYWGLSFKVFILKNYCFGKDYLHTFHNHKTIDAHLHRHIK